MEELEQKHLHLLQVVESEKTAKWQYTQHCEELTEEIKKLRNEVSSVTRLGDLLHFWQLFKAFGNSYFAQNVHIFIVK